MKKFLSLLILLCIEKSLHAQYVYTIKADSVKITNTCDTAELIIENHTQNVPGFLFNKGRGRTEFRRATLLNDSTVILGGDTLLIRGGDYLQEVQRMMALVKYKMPVHIVMIIQTIMAFMLGWGNVHRS